MKRMFRDCLVVAAVLALICFVVWYEVWRAQKLLEAIDNKDTIGIIIYGR